MSLIRCLPASLSPLVLKGLVICSLSWFGTGVMLSEVKASERLILTYGPFEQTVYVDNLEIFAETGETSRELDFLIGVSRQEPENVRRLLTQELSVNYLFLYKILHTLPGEYVLYELGKIIHTKSHRANIESLRAAIVMSAREDNRVNLLEFFQNYPTREMYVDGVQGAKVANQVSRLINRVQEALQLPLAIAKEVLGGIICQCETPENNSSIP